MVSFSVKFSLFLIFSFFIPNLFTNILLFRSVTAYQTKGIRCSLFDGEERFLENAFGNEESYFLIIKIIKNLCIKESIQKESIKIFNFSFNIII